MRIFVPAKLNLSLNITGFNGVLHTLDSVFAPLSFGDEVEVLINKNACSHTVTFLGGEIDPMQNTAYKAADAVKKTFNLPHFFDIKITKNIPVAAGLGGSAADAAGVVLALDKMYNLFKTDGQKYEFCALIGSDVAAMAYGAYARVLGTGGLIKPFKSGLKFDAVVLTCETGVNSGQSYKKFDELFLQKKSVLTDNGLLIDCLKNGKKQEAISLFSNALTPASLELNPQIKTALERLKNAGAVKTIMAGSGSACVGFFTDSIKAAAAAKTLNAIQTVCG